MVYSEDPGNSSRGNAEVLQSLVEFLGVRVLGANKLGLGVGKHRQDVVLGHLHTSLPQKVGGVDKLHMGPSHKGGVTARGHNGHLGLLKYAGAAVNLLLSGDGRRSGHGGGNAVDGQLGVEERHL